MKIKCVGRKRVDKAHILMNQDISEIMPSKEMSESETANIVLDSSGIWITVEKENLVLNGNFRIQISINKKEIINLARIALADEPIGEVVKAFAKSSK